MFTGEQARAALAEKMREGMHGDEACVNCIADQLLSGAKGAADWQVTYHNARMILAEYVAGQKRLDLMKMAQRSFGEAS